MEIRKKFTVESAHRVPQCSTDRCKKSLHGHHGVFEVILNVNALDFGAMGIDFGILKGTVRDFIDSFDHTYIFWKNEPDHFKNFIKQESARWIEMPISASAEGFSLLAAYVIDKIIKNTDFQNGEDTHLKSVRYHETETGYAEADILDVGSMWLWTLEDIIFSDEIKKEWKDPEMWDKLIEGKRFKNQIVKLTHGLHNVDCEIWRDVVDYEGHYQVSNLGRVKTIKKERQEKILKGTIHTNGYRHYCFWKDGVDSYYFGHQLVAKAFLYNLERKMYVNHIDGNKLNNRLENLEWVTHQENMNHTKKHLVHKERSIIDEDAVIVIRDRVANGESRADVAKDYEIHLSTVNNIINYKTWKHVR